MTVLFYLIDDGYITSAFYGCAILPNWWWVHYLYIFDGCAILPKGRWVLYLCIFDDCAGLSNAVWDLRVARLAEEQFLTLFFWKILCGALDSHLEFSMSTT